MADESSEGKMPMPLQIVIEVPIRLQHGGIWSSGSHLIKHRNMGKYVLASLQIIFRCCCLPTDCLRDFRESGSQCSPRHDAHLSASNHLPIVLCL
ncbi:hypothetical protein EVAR_71040_1 [Eumeta japonica]|uniref:Uncharacterized protein n=1 Tax=Eumeta variegata TaxID=151549 RepID=A0A4C2A8P1_EUMVA|nr:hypothetical protein EVAR_71040_1 [Eumeta japonica]